MTIREEGYAEGYRDGYSKRDDEIVRCKDCKHWDKSDFGWFCPYHHNAKPDWFCADGERNGGDVE